MEKLNYPKATLTQCIIELCFQIAMISIIVFQIIKFYKLKDVDNLIIAVLVANIMIKSAADFDSKYSK